MALAVFVIFVAVPVIRAAVIESDTTSGDGGGVDRALGASDQLSVHDQSVVTGLGTHVRRFNAAALPLINGYLDPTVSAIRWVRTAGGSIDEMRAAVATMEADILSIEDDGVRNTMLTLSDGFREEVVAIIELRNAVAHLDRRGERMALIHLRRAAAERRQMALGLLDQLRPYVDPETLREILQTAAQGN